MTKTSVKGTQREAVERHLLTVDRQSLISYCLKTFDKLIEVDTERKVLGEMVKGQAEQIKFLQSRSIFGIFRTRFMILFDAIMKRINELLKFWKR